MNVEYSGGRFFVSPIIGCNGNCVYCYIDTKLPTTSVRTNLIEIDTILHEILSHPQYVPGKTGSIISIGAWGDIFPRNNKKLIAFSVVWIKKLLSLGNPVQIMSKFTIDKNIVDEICCGLAYDNQLLYSITITTFNKWRVLEPYTDSPEDRLKTMELFKNNSVKTNVMIKPFLPGITEKEVDLFRLNFLKYKPDYCVAGIIYCDDKIKSRLTIIKEYKDSLEVLSTLLDTNQILDCSGSLKIDAMSSKHLNAFISNLKDIGVMVFKKSSCVNSNVLGTKNIAGYNEFDPHSFCVECGNCLTNSGIEPSH